MTTFGNISILVATAGVAFGASLLLRRLLPELSGLEPGPWTATLSYVATAFGVLIGFTIVFFLGEFRDARQAAVDEATAVRTVSEEARLFPASRLDIEHALICYSRAVSEREWPDLARRKPAPEVDRAYADIVRVLADADGPGEGPFQRATATNLVVQVGAIAQAREARLFAAETRLTPMLWGVLIGGGLFVLALLFVVSSKAPPMTQALLVSLAGVFTIVLLLLVGFLSSPFEGADRLEPDRIEETRALIEERAPAAARPCPLLDG